MRIFRRDQPCEKLASIEQRLDAVEETLATERLKYLELYEIARRNLAKMAQRAAGEEPDDEMSAARKALAERKLARGS